MQVWTAFTFFWSTLSWPDFVREGPRREYFKVSCSVASFGSRGGLAVIIKP